MNSKKQLINAINELITKPHKLNKQELEKLIYIREQIKAANDRDKILYYLEDLVKLTGIKKSDFPEYNTD